MRAAQIDDFVKVSIEITDDQGKKEKMNEMQVHLGHNTFLPEIEQKFIGMNINETLVHDFTIPETASIINDERLAGKQVKLLFEIKDIQGSREFDQEDIFEHFNVNSITELEEKFKNEIEKNITKHSQFLLKETLKQELLKTFFEIPMQILQSKYIEIRKQMLAEMGYKEGEDEKTLVKEKMNLEIEEFDKRSLFIAEAIARLNFLISHFARKMQLEISNLELDDAIFEQKNAFPNGLQEAVKFFAENTKARENLTTRLMENKVLLMIASKCSLETKNHKLAEFYQINLQNSPQLEATNDAISSSTESKESDDESSEKKVKSKGVNKKIETNKENK
jgi:trigger factor